MDAWNFDISQAPTGQMETIATGKTDKQGNPIYREVHVSPRIIAAGSKGVVTLSKWLPDEGRWEMFSKDAPPLAWMLWPSHPHGPRSL